MTVDDTVIIGAFSTAWVAMGTVVGVLWRKLSASEKLVALLNERIANLTGDGGMLKHCPAPRCPYRGDRVAVIPDHLNSNDPSSLHA